MECQQIYISIWTICLFHDKHVIHFSKWNILLNAFDFCIISFVMLVCRARTVTSIKVRTINRGQNEIMEDGVCANKLSMAIIKRFFCRFYSDGDEIADTKEQSNILLQIINLLLCRVIFLQNTFIYVFKMYILIVFSEIVIKIFLMIFLVFYYICFFLI